MKRSGLTLALMSLPARVIGWLLLAVLAIAPPLPAIAAEPVAFTEHQIKAAFLFNFTQFVEWPSNTFTNAEAPLVIGILGDDPLGPALEQAVEGETVNKRPIAIRRSRHLSELKGNCHVLFICRSEKARLPQLLAELRGQPVLTVAEINQFALQGGIIGFVIRDNKVRFEINLATAERAGLKVSSKLSKLAVATYTETDKESR